MTKIDVWSDAIRAWVMGWSSTRVAGMVALVPSVLWMGCGPPPCHSDPQRGDTLQVEVLERYEEGGAFEYGPSVLEPSCGDLGDLVPGDRHSLELSHYLGKSLSCELLACPDDFPTPSESLDGRLGGTALGVRICALYAQKVTLTDRCQVERSVSIEAIDLPVPFDSVPTPGEVPPTVVRRQLSATLETCPDMYELFPPESIEQSEDEDFLYCGDTFVLSVSEER